MAYLLSSERPAAAAMPDRPANLVLRWIAKLRAARTRRMTVACLLAMDDARLRDLGLVREDILGAARDPDMPVGRRLTIARARNARG